MEIIVREYRNNVNITLALLQRIGDKDEPNIVFMRNIYLLFCILFWWGVFFFLYLKNLYCTANVMIAWHINLAHLQREKFKQLNILFFFNNKTMPVTIYLQSPSSFEVASVKPILIIQGILKIYKTIFCNTCIIYYFIIIFQYTFVTW